MKEGGWENSGSHVLFVYCVVCFFVSKVIKYEKNKLLSDTNCREQAG